MPGVSNARKRSTTGYTVVLLWLASCMLTAAQSHLKITPTLKDADEISWTTQNTKISSSHADVGFSVCFDLLCSSTLPQGLETQSILKIKNEQDEEKAAIDILETPDKTYAAVFETMGKQEFQLSVWDIAPGMLCKNIWYKDKIPSHCLSMQTLKAKCTGQQQECMFEAKLKDTNEQIKLKINWNKNVKCDDKSVIVVLKPLDIGQNNVEICAKRAFNRQNVYEFNQIGNEEMAVYFDSTTNEMFVNPNLKTHDDIESGVFTFALILFLIVWTEITKGGIVSLNKSLFFLKKNEKILTVDVAISILVTSCFSIAKHGRAIIPSAVAIIFSNTVASVVIVLYILMVAIAAMSTLVIVAKSNETSIEIKKSIMLRHSVDFLIMLAAHLHFPLALSLLLREILGLVLAVTVSAVIGRDIAVIAIIQKKKLNKMFAITIVLFLLVLNHAALVLALPVIYRSSGIADSSAVYVSVALVIVTCTASIIYNFKTYNKSK